MFNFFKRKKTKVKPKSMRKNVQKPEYIQLGREIAILIYESNNVVYSYIAKVAIEKELYYSFLDTMSDVMEVREDMMREMVGDENIKKMWQRIYDMSR